MSTEHSTAADTRPRRRRRRRRRPTLVEVLALIAGVCAVITGVVGVVQLFAGDEGGKSDVAKYQDQVLDLCDEILAIGKEDAGIELIDPRTGKVRVAALVRIGNARLDRMQDRYDQFFGRPTPRSLRDERKTAEDAIARWHDGTRNVYLPAFEQRLPGLATVSEVNAVEADLRPGYSPLVANLNNSLTALAGDTCTAIAA